jgi:voltage-gated potassium channel
MFLDFRNFVREVGALLAVIKEIVVLLLCALLVLTMILAVVEDLSFRDAIYFAAITGLTIGFGDITPNTPLGRLVVIVIGLLGIVFTGIVVALVNRALAYAAAEKRRRLGQPPPDSGILSRDE